MKKLCKGLITCCISMTLMGTITSMASMDMETESSVAGISVALNNYFASSMNPEVELGQALSSDSVLAQSTASPVPKEVPKVAAPQSAYANIAISKVTDYVNVRQEASTGSSVVGKIYNNCAATILETVDGESGKWYKIQSGTVTGYIKAQYFITGAEAEAIAKQIGTVYGTVVNTTSLRLREKPDLESDTLTLLAEGAHYQIIEEQDNFAKIAVDTDLEGYVFKEYLQTNVEFQNAVSAEEETAKANEEAKLKQEAADAIKKLENTKKEEAQKKTTAAQKTEAPTAAPTKAPASGNGGTVAAKPDNTAKTAAVSPPPAPTQKATTAAPVTVAPPIGNGPGGSSSGQVESATRNAVVAYSKQFLGNPYVYGGTSLTNGADCSGFTQSIFSHFGISIGRSSRDQAAKGREISTSSVQPGDLLFYASGNYINHVALYIGGGQVIHASTPTSGICITSANYRTPCKAVSFLD